MIFFVLLQLQLQSVRLPTSLLDLRTGPPVVVRQLARNPILGHVDLPDRSPLLWRREIEEESAKRKPSPQFRRQRADRIARRNPKAAPVRHGRHDLQYCPQTVPRRSDERVL